MAADLHIHIKTDKVTDRDLAIFFSHILGSKYCNFPLMIRFGPEEENRASEAVMKSPNIWIGEVSWLKAALTEDSETFVPSSIQRINDYIGEDQPVLDNELIDKIVGALNVENKTDYSLAKPEEVRKFLEEHKGKKVFTVSW